MTQPGVGPITSLAFVLTLRDMSRFKRGKNVASYLGLIPRERSSGGKQRLGAINKQGSSFMRTLLVESAQSVTRLDEGFRKQYSHRCHRMVKGVAKVAALESAKERFPLPHRPGGWMFAWKKTMSKPRPRGQGPESVTSGWRVAGVSWLPGILHAVGKLPNDPNSPLFSVSVLLGEHGHSPKWPTPPAFLDAHSVSAVRCRWSSKFHGKLPNEPNMSFVFSIRTLDARGPGRELSGRVC
jgi:hypothetical protein